jgi:hypothetical protein
MDSGERGLYHQIHPAVLAAFVPAGWSTGCWGPLARVSS